VTKRFLQVPELVVGFDTETTGLDVTLERAISYGFCAYRYGQPEEEEHFFVLPDRPISDGARKVHGLSVEDIERKRLINRFGLLCWKEGLTHTVEILSRYRDLNAYSSWGLICSRFDVEMLRWSYRVCVFAGHPMMMV
jgi:DNA polymerase III epsilon subunit-like protein